jgi:ribonuclease HI
VSASPPVPVPIRIVFDGGSINNPGRGYGSYQIVVDDEPPRIERLEFGDRVTNNEAEYLALIHGLEDAVRSLEARGIDSKAARVDVRGDSQLVLKQVKGEWKVRMAHLQPLNKRARDLVQKLGSVSLTWHRRSESVRILGH